MKTPDVDRGRFGAYLATRRRQTGYPSQRAWAEALNKLAGTQTLTRHEVSRWERGLRRPDSWLPLIARSLGVSVEELAQAAPPLRPASVKRSGSVGALVEWPLNTDRSRLSFTDVPIDELLAHLKDQWHALVRADNLLGPQHALRGVLDHLVVLS